MLATRMQTVVIVHIAGSHFYGQPFFGEGTGLMIPKPRRMIVGGVVYHPDKIDPKSLNTKGILHSA